MAYDLVGALAVSHSLLDSEHAHALDRPAPTDDGLDAHYLPGLNAPFDLEEADVGSLRAPLRRNEPADALP